MYQPKTRRWGERGQTTIALAGVLAVALLAIGAVAVIGESMVHRARARNAADAVALSTVADPATSRELIAWYQQRGVEIEQQDAATIARSGPSQAAAWASRSSEQSGTAPVIRAVVARLSQLVGHDFVAVQWGDLSFRLLEADADRARPFAAEFGLCVGTDDRGGTEWRTFELC